MDERPRDAHTTPRWLQLPGLLLLGALAAYLGVCYHVALGKPRPALVADWSPHALWPGTWQMFTLLDRRHSALTAEAIRGDTSEPIDLGELFPTTWESGYRFSRSSFRKSPTRMRVLAAATCGRLAERPDEVRFTLTQWGKTLGDPDQPKNNPKVRTLLTWDCSRRVDLPEGRRL